MKKIVGIMILCLFGFQFVQIKAQIISSSYNLTAQPIPDRSVYFCVTDTGISKPINFGLDLAWLDEGNIRRGITFMGTDRVKIVRSSFTPTSALENGDLPSAELATLNKRIKIIKTWLDTSKIEVVLNCDNPTVASYYLGMPANWAKLIDVTTRHHQEAGLKVVSVSPFNEPDYGWGQYSGANGQSDFYNIAGELRKISRFNDIRICGGNTLNCDQALNWYTFLQDRLEEGNTHQLAGSFNNFATFFQTVRANGDVATGDELHNVMEAMVGAEYGMQNGIWWETANWARGEFVKASDGKRLAYAEHRAYWTAASVYRSPEGKVQAFGGTSERQAAKTTYRFVSKDRDVFFDGYGPQREYTMVLPGGAVGSYQNGQTNAERVVNITWGDDIQPVINGKYIIVNRLSGKVLEVPNGSTTDGTYLKQNTNAGTNYQQWNVTPVASTIGGDYSYFSFTAMHSGKVMDNYNWSLENGGLVDAWTSYSNTVQQWFLEYAGNGWFFIRNRFSGKCLEVADSSLVDGANIQQWDKDGGANQQWRLVSVNAKIDFEAPAAPANLLATPAPESVRLDWKANTESDVVGYTVFRADSVNGTFNTLARNVTTPSFVDNTATFGGPYYYAVKAVDASLNSSAFSSKVSASSTNDKALVLKYSFEGNVHDTTLNLNHGSTYGTVLYARGKKGLAIRLNGSDAFIQLPPYMTHQKNMTIAAWIYWKGGSSAQNIFNFSANDSAYMYMTPSTSAGNFSFGIANGGTEQSLNAAALASGCWVHVAVSLDDTLSRLFVNGAVVDSEKLTINPLTIKPFSNYVGRSSLKAKPLFNGFIDDFRVYNYALSPIQVQQIVADTSAVTNSIRNSYQQPLKVWPLPAVEFVNVSFEGKNNGKSVITLLDMNGRVMLTQELANVSEAQINVSNLASGTYYVKLTNVEGVTVKKVIICHSSYR
jgi:hypothetical protein